MPSKMSPRRSSRARTTQPPNGSEPAPSSGSSTSSHRADRSTRSHHKTSTPQKPSTPRSRSSVEADDSARHTHSEPPQTRRRKREVGDEDDPMDGQPTVQDKAGGGDTAEDADEEGVVRCICGQAEYQGPPATDLAPETKPAVITEVDPNGDPSALENPPEVEGALFIQCDICEVWQHGGCVGIMNQASCPDNYFCELCRKDLHQIIVGPNGEHTSRYLPVLEPHSQGPSRATSHVSKDGDSKTSGDRSLRPPTRGDRDHGGKRRSTMNSRDAAYDEEEQLRQAIEASKAERLAKAEAAAGNRKGKRGRGESEETGRDSFKRQRTMSGSPSPPSHQNTHSTSLTADSDDDEQALKEGRPRKVRSSAHHNHRERETRERDREKERERADAAGRRRGRAERRRGDDSEASDEGQDPKPGKDTPAEDALQAAEPLPSSSQPPPDTPPTNNNHTTNNGNTSGHRKTGRPPARRGRVGRNQYTKDRDLRNDAADESRDHSRVRDGSDAPNGNGHTSHPHSSSNGDTHPTNGKPSRPKYMHPQRTTMNEMKRRVAAILEFISRTQLEMASLAGEETPPAGARANEAATATLLKGIADSLPSIAVTNGDGAAEQGRGGIKDKPFAELTSLEMMDVLTRKLVLWQKDFGKWGEK